MKLYTSLLMLIALIGYCQDISYDGLKQAAYRHSHTLKLAHIDTLTEQTRLESLYSSLYPQLSVGYNGEYSKNLDAASSGAGNITVGDMTISPNTLYKNSLALRLNYELYRFGTTLKQIEVNEKEIAIKRLDECREEGKLYQTLLEHYLHAQKADSEYRYKRRIHSLRSELYGWKQRLYEAGKESRVSVGEEAIRLIDLEREIEKSAMTYQENLIALNKLSFIDLDTQNTRLLPLDLTAEPVETLAFENVPYARQYREKIEQKNVEITMLNRSQLPTVSLYSSYYLYGNDSSSIPDTFDATRPNSWNAGLSIRWSIFEGFKYNSESERLHLELSRLNEEYALANREFDYDIQTKQQRLKRLALLTKNETDALHALRDKLTLTERLRAQGESDALSEVSVKIEALEREMTLDIETLQHAYEAESLRLQYRGVDECTLH